MKEYRRAEYQYLDWAERILADGEPDDDRTGVGTIELFGEAQMTYDLRREFPALTTKRIAFTPIKGELAWMLQGRQDLRFLLEHDTHIWDEWPFVGYLRDTHQAIPTQGSNEWREQMAAYRQKVLTDDTFSRDHGMLGRVYGVQWRDWLGLSMDENGVYQKTRIDQLADIQEHIRHITEPDHKKYGRRLIMSAWNASQIEEMSNYGLPPCHTLYQFNASTAPDPTTGKKYLDMKVCQRSADWFLGVPFNMVQAALLLCAMAQTTDREPRFLHQTFGSAHIYKNHIPQIREQLSRRGELFDAPTVALNPNVTDIGKFEPNDFNILDYKSHGPIKGQVAI